MAKNRGNKRLECFPLPIPATRIERVRARLTSKDGWGVRSLELQTFVGLASFISFSPNAADKSFDMDGNAGGYCKDGSWCTLKDTREGKC